MEHSSVGASSCERWWNCPGQIQYAEQLGVKSTTSEYAAWGTVAHNISEQLLMDFKRGATKKDVIKELWKFEDEVIECDDYEILVNEDMCDCVETYIVAVLDMLGDLPREYLHVESQFTLDFCDGAFGTCDAVIYEPFKRLVVCDLKTGKGVLVDPEMNKQIMYYALGALQDFDAATVECVIVQPRTGRDEAVKKWSVEASYLLNEFKPQLAKKIKATKGKNPKLNPGKYCKFCPCLAECKEIHKKTQEVAKSDFSAKKLPDPAGLTTEQIRKVLDFSYILEEWIPAVRAHAQGLAMRGHDVPGYKLVRKRANRAWIDKKEVENALADYGDDIYKQTLKTPNQMEKVVSKELVEELAHKPEGAIVLARETDKREAIDVSPQSDFTTITD